MLFGYRSYNCTTRPQVAKGGKVSKRRRVVANALIKQKWAPDKGCSPV